MDVPLPGSEGERERSTTLLCSYLLGWLMKVDEEALVLIMNYGLIMFDFWEMFP